MTSAHLRLAKIGGFTGAVLTVLGLLVVPNPLLFQTMSCDRGDCYLPSDHRVRISKIEVNKFNRRSGGPNGAAYYSNFRGISYYTVKGGRRQFVTNFTMASWTNGTVEISVD